eukprot:Clim_evm76s149 gene=Clim_evmTU76s149
MSIYRVEEDVGITEYASPNAPVVHGVLKQRIDDFIVREITLDRKIVRLTDTTTIPKEDIEYAKQTASATEEDRDKLKASFRAAIDSCGSEADHSAETCLEQLQSLQDSEDREEEIVLPYPSDKQQRKHIHMAIRSLFGGKMESEASTVGDTQRIKVFKGGKRQKGESRSGSGGRGSGRFDKRKNNLNRDPNRAKYLQMVLYKKGMDMAGAMSTLAHTLKRSNHKVTFAGTKDKRGCTVQYVTVPNVNATDAIKINEPQGWRLRVGNFSYTNNPQVMGHLGGNFFEITLRNVGCSENEAIEAIEALSKNGFINYFGLQRFGTGAMGTHESGHAILKKDWNAFLDGLLGPPPEVAEEKDTGEEADKETADKETADNAAAKKGDKNGTNGKDDVNDDHDDSGEATGAIKLRAIREDELKARQQWIETRNPKTVYDLFPSRCGTERRMLYQLQRQGKKQDACWWALQALPKSNWLMYLHGFQSFLWNRAASERIKRYGVKAVVGDLVLVPRGRAEKFGLAEVKFIESEEEAAQTPLSSIVLPVPGHAVQYPKHSIGNLFDHMIKETGVDLNSRSTMQGMSLRGDYRQLFVVPTDVDFDYVSYDEKMAKLARDDLDILENVPSEAREDLDGHYKAIILRFGLPSGTYATMLIRELMKTSSSALHHIGLGKEASKLAQ